MSNISKTVDQNGILERNPEEQYSWYLTHNGQSGISPGSKKKNSARMLECLRQYNCYYYPHCRWVGFKS